MKYIKIIVILMFFVLPMIISTPARAIDQPDATPSVSHVHGFQYLIEEGDVLIYGDYSIPYTTPPDDVSARYAYTFQLLDSEGNELGAVVPYVYFDNGFNLGAFGMYFSAADNLTFGEEYTIRISQNPAYFASPQTFDYVMPLSVWSTAETQDDSQLELALAIIATAERLESEYTGYTLIESGIVGTVLASPIGETYFRGAVYGVQVMAPSLFIYQIIPYDTTYERTYGENLSENYSQRFTATWVETDIEATGEQFGMTGQAVAALIFAFPVCLGFIIVSAKKFHTVNPGILVSALIVLMTYMMGWMPPAIFATIYQLCGIYIAYVWFYSKSS